MKTIFIMLFIFVIIICARRSKKKDKNPLVFKEFFKDTLRGLFIVAVGIAILLIGSFIFQKFIK